MPYLGAVQLATTTLGSSASSVTFSNIPTKLNGLYLRDLILVAQITSTGNYSQPSMRLNSDTGSNYSTVRMTGNGSSASSASYTEAAIALYNSGLATNERVTVITQLMDYSATDKHKTLLTRWNTTTDTVAAAAHRWANTSAVTSLSVGTFIGSYTQQFASGSTFTLYATVRKP